MSDTAYVSPHVEDQEMGKIREIFDRALNAMVDATTLAKSVEQLRTDLDSLKTQVTHYRNTIANQDDQITRLRQERDAARTSQYQAEDHSRHMATELENNKREVESLASSNVRLNDRISELTKERDDAQFKLLELTESHSALSKKLDEVKTHMQSLFGLAVPLHEPVPEPVVVSPVTWNEEAHPTEPAAPVNPPEPTPAQWPSDIR